MKHILSSFIISSYKLFIQQLQLENISRLMYDFSSDFKNASPWSWNYFVNNVLFTVMA